MLEIAEQSGTRKAKGPIFKPSPLDIQYLLAAIAKIETKEQTQVTLERLTPKEETFQPDFSPTRAKVLDSLANLCVSKTSHEVIATAVRVDNKAESIELIIASNTDVPNSIVAQLQEIWKTLKRISTLCHKDRNLTPKDDTPSQRTNND